MSALSTPAPAAHTLLPGTWGRRALSLPLLHLATVLWLALLPVHLVLLGTADLLLRRRLGGVRFALFVALVLVAEVAGVWLAGLTWLRHGRDPAALLASNTVLQRRWSDALWRGLVALYALEVEVEGAEVVAPGPILLLVRHASTADTLLPAVVAANPHALRLRYVLKRELLWDPCLDIVGQRLPNHFVDRTARTAQEREAERSAVAELARGLGPDEGVIIFPEGTRFSPGRRARRLAAAEEAGDTAEIARIQRYRRCFPPRPAGVFRVHAAAPRADLVFCAHRGFEVATRLPNLWNGRLVGARISLRLWRVPAAEVPLGKEAQRAWLLDQWDAVERYLAEGGG